MVKLYLTVLSFVADFGDRMRRDDEGATAVEYGLMVALIAAGIIVAVAFLRDNLVTIFDKVGTSVGNSVP